MESLYRRALEELDSFCEEMKRLWSIFLDETPIARRFTKGWLASADISKSEKASYQDPTVRSDSRIR